ncbi:hypothetical protein [Geobacter sp.]|uniref:hypothetical protein n=1 Tax=Geobacter sp. TaxID=46610 RepID=UPI002606ECDA|nr:hypothetical protein [Geobacter sp.]
MKYLVRLPERLLYVMPRVLLLSLFVGYVSFMFFSSCDWFKPFEQAVHGLFLRLVSVAKSMVSGVPK